MADAYIIEKVREHVSGDPRTQVVKGEQYGVSQSTVSRFVNGHTYHSSIVESFMRQHPDIITEWRKAQAEETQNKQSQPQSQPQAQPPLQPFGMFAQCAPGNLFAQNKAFVKPIHDQSTVDSIKDGTHAHNRSDHCLFDNDISMVRFVDSPVQTNVAKVFKAPTVFANPTKEDGEVKKDRMNTPGGAFTVCEELPNNLFKTIFKEVTVRNPIQDKGVSKPTDDKESKPIEKTEVIAKPSAAAESLVKNKLKLLCERNNWLLRENSTYYHEEIQFKFHFEIMVNQHCFIVETQEQSCVDNIQKLKADGLKKCKKIIKATGVALVIPTQFQLSPLVEGYFDGKNVKILRKNDVDMSEREEESKKDCANGNISFEKDLEGWIRAETEKADEQESLTEHDLKTNVHYLLRAHQYLEFLQRNKSSNGKGISKIKSVINSFAKGIVDQTE